MFNHTLKLHTQFTWITITPTTYNAAKKKKKTVMIYNNVRKRKAQRIRSLRQAFQSFWTPFSLNRRLNRFYILQSGRFITQ